jgi:protocatechuate 3,4-dioxygenase beta subunit
VKAPDGKPVEAAWILAGPTLRLEGPPVTTRTDKQGRFRLTLERSLPHAVRVYARGFASTLLDAVKPGTPLTITLDRGRAIEGRVLDSTSGQPVPAARVWTRVGRGLTWEPAAGIVETRTDAKGRFRLEGLGHGPVDVLAEARGFGRGARSRAGQRGTVEIVLLPGGSIVGVVTDPHRRPVAGAVVRAEQTDGWLRPTLLTTDADGRFEVAGLEPKAYRVLARHPGFAPALLPSVIVEADAEASVELPLDAPAAVAGRLVDLEGRPVAGDVVLVEANGSSLPESLRELLRARATAEGRFLLEGLPPGSHALQVTAPGLAARRIDFDARREAPLELGDVVLEAGLAIRGRVHDAAGAAIANARVGAARTPEGEDRSEAWTEADGRFALGGLRGGTYGVTVRASGFAVAQTKVEAGGDDVDVTLTAGGTITGQVVEESGRAVERFDVWADTPEETGAGYERVESADGRFTLTEAAEGEYVLRVDAPGNASAVVSGVRVRAGAGTDVGRVRLTRGGVVRGRVTDAASAPIAGAAVAVEDPAGQGSGFLQTKTDLSGGFELAGVPAGSAQVHASHPQYAPGRVTGLVVDPASGPTDVTVVLTQGGRVEGSVRNRDGSPVLDATVQAYVRNEIQRSTPVAADGRFVFEHLRAGGGFLMLLGQKDGRRIASARRGFMVQEGESTTVDIVLREVLVSGHVMRGGAPVAGVHVSFMGEGSALAIAGDDGRYGLTISSPGPHHVRVDRADGRGGLGSHSVDVPDQETFVWDIDLTSVATVSGAVNERESGKPVSDAQITAREPVGAIGPWARSGSDGRFELLVEPGDNALNVSAEGFMAESQTIQVPAAGLAGLQLLLRRGGTVRGRVLDLAGRPVQGLEVAARGSDGYSMASAETRADGSYVLNGLRNQGHTVSVGSGEVGFAWKTGVMPGSSDVELILQSPGRLRLRVIGPDGSPVAGAWAYVEKVNGVRVTFMYTGGSVTDVDGIGVLALPTGSLDIVAGKDDTLEGRMQVESRAETPAEAEIRLAEKAPTEGS